MAVEFRLARFEYALLAKVSNLANKKLVDTLSKLGKYLVPRFEIRLYATNTFQLVLNSKTSTCLELYT